MKAARGPNFLGAAGRSSVSGEIGIRTLDTGLTPYNGLANRRLQPLGHLSGEDQIIRGNIEHSTSNIERRNEGRRSPHPNPLPRSTVGEGSRGDRIGGGGGG